MNQYPINTGTLSTTPEVPEPVQPQRELEPGRLPEPEFPSYPESPNIVPDPQQPEITPGTPLPEVPPLS